MSNSYTIEAILKATDAGFSSTFKNANKMMDSLQGTAKNSSGIFDKVFGSAGGFMKANVVMGTVSKAIGMVTNSIGAAVGRVDTMARFPKMMQAWGISAEDSEKSIQTLSKGIDGLPTKLDDVVGVAQQITMLNGDLGKSTDLTLALNNAFLASGSSAADTSRGLLQYTQMMSSGKVDMMAWRTLQETMPVGLQKTAEAFGFAGASAKNDLYSALQDGTLTFDQFNEKIMELNGGVGGFAELAKVNSVGIATSWTNIQTTVSKGVGSMIKSLNDSMIASGFGSISDNLNKFKDGLNAAFKAVNPLVGDLVSNIGKIVPAVGAVAGGLVVLRGALPIMDVFNKGFGVISKNADVAGGALKVFGGNIATNLEVPLSKIPSAITTSGGVGMRALSTSLGGMETLVKGALMIIGPAAIIGGVLAGLGLAYAAFGPEIDKLINTAITKGPAIIKGLVDGITSMLPNLIDSGAKMVTGFADVIVANLPTIIQGGVQIIGSLLQGVGTNSSQLIGSAVKIMGTFINSILMALPQLIVMGMDLIMSLVNGVIANLPMITSSVINIITTLVTGFAGLLPQIIQTGISILLALVSGLVAVLPALIPAAVGAIQTLVQTLVANLPAIMGGALMVINALFNGLVTNLPIILSGALQIMLSILTGIIQALPSIIAGGAEIIVNLLFGIIKNLPQILDAGRNIISELAKGIIDMGFKAVEAVGKVALDILNKVKNFFSFGTGSGGMQQAGGNIATDIQTGMENKAQQPYTAADTVAKGVDERFDTGLARISNHGSTSMDSLNSTIGGAEGALIGTSSGLTASMEATFGAGLDFTGTLGTGAMTELSTGMESQTGLLNSTTTGLTTGVEADFTKGFAGSPDWGKTAMTGMASGVTSGQPAVVSSVKSVMDSTESAVKATFSKAHIWGIDAMNNLAGGIGAAASAVAYASRSMASNAAAGITGVFASAYTWGSHMAQGLASGISAGSGAVLSAAYSLAAQVSAILHFTRPDTGPLRNYETWMPHFVQGLAAGIDKTAPKLIGKVAAMAEGVRDASEFGVSNQMINISSQLGKGGNLAINESVQLNTQPATIHLHMGNRDFKAYVSDITKAQNESLEMELLYT